MPTPEDQLDRDQDCTEAYEPPRAEDVDTSHSPAETASMISGGPLE